ncbi:MAG: hypothetical protein AAFV90_21095 [Cyanobacteria bacterium J06634_5]
MNEEAELHVTAFENKFGIPHLHFACHAAFLPTLTPDLLYRLWVVFSTDIYGYPLNVPWIAIADFIFSSLCQEVGYELYEIKAPIQLKLRALLYSHQNFGQGRVSELANFFLEYAEDNYESEDLDVRELAWSLRYTALAYTAPREAAKSLLRAFKETSLRKEDSISQKDLEIIRLGSLVESFSAQLKAADLATVLDYSRGMVSFSRNDIESALIHFNEFLQEPINEKNDEDSALDFFLPPVLKTLIRKLDEENLKRQIKSDAIFLVFSILSLLIICFPIALVWGGGAATLFFLVLSTPVGVVFLSKYPKQALYTFLCYLPFSGTVTYALGGDYYVLSFLKDIFYLSTLIGVAQLCRRKQLPIVLPESIKLTLGLVISIVVVTILTTNLPDQIQNVNGKFPLLMGLFGLKVLLGYVPLITCTYYLIRTKKDFYSLMRLQVVLVLVACSLGFFQYFMLETGICAGTIAEGAERFRASLDARCFVGGSLLYAPAVGQIRLPGTFFSPWYWGWFLISGCFFCYGTAFNDKSSFWRAMGVASILSILIVAFVSGQKMALVLVPFSLILLAPITNQLGNLKRFFLGVFVMGIVLIPLAVNNQSILENQTDSLVARWNYSPPHSFMKAQFTQVLQEQEGILGHGVGRATDSARPFGRSTLIQTYHAKLMHELGPLGLIFMLALYTTLTLSTLKAYRSIKDKNLRSYAASMWSFVLFISFFPYYYPLDVDPVNVYFWVAAGLTLRLPKIAARSAEPDSLLTT